MTDTRREALARLIEVKLRSVRSSDGYRDTAEQIADSLLENLPVTAQQVAWFEFQTRAYHNIFMEKQAVAQQFQAHLARCRREADQ